MSAWHREYAKLHVPYCNRGAILLRTRQRLQRAIDSSTVLSTPRQPKGISSHLH